MNNIEIVKEIIEEFEPMTCGICDWYITDPSLSYEVLHESDEITIMKDNYGWLVVVTPDQKLYEELCLFYHSRYSGENLERKRLAVLEAKKKEGE